MQSLQIFFIAVHTYCIFLPHLYLIREKKTDVVSLETRDVSKLLSVPCEMRVLARKKEEKKLIFSDALCRSRGWETDEK